MSANAASSRSLNSPLSFGGGPATGMFTWMPTHVVGVLRAERAP